MSKRILIWTGSPRRNGNSDALAEAFNRGAISSGHTTTTVQTAEKHIEGCRACNMCFTKEQACIFDDDFNEIAELVENADVLAFITPLYWFTFPSKMKAAIDKLHSFTTVKKTMSVKECVLLVCATKTDVSVYDGIVRTYEEIANYNRWSDRGKLLATGIRELGAIQNTQWLVLAELMGAAL
jgi:multimeric flavodoxin WrbA